MKAANGGAAGEDAVVQAEQVGSQQLVQVAGLILLVEQVVAEQRDRPAIAAAIDRRPGAEQRIAVDDRLRVGVVDQAAKLLARRTTGSSSGPRSGRSSRGRRSSRNRRGRSTSARRWLARPSRSCGSPEAGSTGKLLESQPACRGAQPGSPAALSYSVNSEFEVGERWRTATGCAAAWRRRRTRSPGGAGCRHCGP